MGSPAFQVEEDELRIMSDTQLRTFLILLISVITLGAFGNIASFVLNIKRNRNDLLMRACINSIIASDIIYMVVLSVVYGYQFSASLPQIWIYGPIWCTLLPFIQTIAMLSNSISLVVLSCDRYMTYIRITKQTWQPSEMLCKTILIFIWGLAIGISSPAIGMYEYISLLVKPTKLWMDEYVVHICAHRRNSADAYYIATIFCSIFFPLLATSAWLLTVIIKHSCCNVSYTVTHGSVTEPDSQAKHKIVTEIKTKQQIRLMKIIVLIMILFFICRFSQWIFELVKFNIKEISSGYYIFHYTLGMLTLSNCMLNPFLFIFLFKTKEIVG